MLRHNKKSVDIVDIACSFELFKQYQAEQTRANKEKTYGEGSTKNLIWITVGCLMGYEKSLDSAMKGLEEKKY